MKKHQATKSEAKKARCGSGKSALVMISQTLVKRVYGVLKSGKVYNTAIPLQG